MCDGPEAIRIVRCDALDNFRACQHGNCFSGEVHKRRDLLAHDEGLRGGRVDSHGDHRVAMSFAIASVRAREPIEISDVANVATSFPGFPAAARSVGLALDEGRDC